MKLTYHKPVLCEAAIAALAIRPNGVYVDATFGGGGHARSIVEALGLEGKLFAFDQDTDAQQNLIDDPRFTFIPANFEHLKRFLRLHKIAKVDGILADFGVSSHQFDTPERGFSTRFSGPLDMRMNSGQELDAAKIINTYTAAALADVFYQFGELRNSRAIASAVVAARASQSIATTTALKEILQPLFPERFFNKRLAQVFQALRIEVNQELEVIKAFLTQAAEVLAPNGRLVCIAYHSLEDRLVKTFIRDGGFSGPPEADLYGRRNLPFKRVQKMQVPTEEEISDNPRARSAKMRVAERL
ncbi:MAG: 16S rRNA (cytosine(1402)-N(4))-methyltransferase RsmH [Flavobacteriaceae bacterium]|jgi:16S rRNA (cytosine1402-N4)-methyltransferase